VRIHSFFAADEKNGRKNSIKTLGWLSNEIHSLPFFFVCNCELFSHLLCWEAGRTSIRMISLEKKERREM
jgi:hypothetical protein